MNKTFHIGYAGRTAFCISLAILHASNVHSAQFDWQDLLGTYKSSSATGLGVIKVEAAQICAYLYRPQVTDKSVTGPDLCKSSPLGKVVTGLHLQQFWPYRDAFSVGSMNILLIKTDKGSIYCASLAAERYAYHVYSFQQVQFIDGGMYLPDCGLPGESMFIKKESDGKLKAQLFKRQYATGAYLTTIMDPWGANVGP